MGEGRTPKVVVTGGAGFIGANLCRTLSEGADIEVVALDDLSTGFASNLDGVDVTFVHGSILDRDCLDNCFEDAHSVVHLAARPSVPRSIDDPVTSHVINTTGTLEVLEAVRRHGVGHVVVASSSSVYGANPTLPKHESLATRPLSPYAATKLATESYALAWQHAYGIGALALRFFNVFGPLQAAGHAYAAVVPAFVDAALAGRPLPVHGDGTQSRDFTYVGTVCAVIAEAVQRRVTSPDPVNLAFGTRTDLLGLITQLEQVLGRPLAREHGSARAGDVAHSQADASALHALFPDVSAVPLADGLADTVTWFEQLTAAGETDRDEVGA